MLGWPKRCKLAHAFLWGYSCERLKLAQLLGRHGVFLTSLEARSRTVWSSAVSETRYELASLGFATAITTHREVPRGDGRPWLSPGRGVQTLARFLNLCFGLDYCWAAADVSGGRRCLHNLASGTRVELVKAQDGLAVP